MGLWLLILSAILPILVIALIARRRRQRHMTSDERYLDDLSYRRGGRKKAYWLRRKWQREGRVS